MSPPPLESFVGNLGRKGERRKKGREREKEEGREKRAKEKGEWSGKEGNCKWEEENFKWKGERYENEQRTLFFWGGVTFWGNHRTLFWVYQNGNFYREKNICGRNFQTSPTFECTPGYAPELEYFKISQFSPLQVIAGLSNLNQPRAANLSVRSCGGPHEAK